MAWPHPITTLGVVTGGIAAYLVAITMSYLEEPQLLAAYLLPTKYADPLGGNTGQNPFVVAVVAQLGLGALLGGLYPWIFHGLLGLGGAWITELPLTIVSGVVLGAALAALTVTATSMDWYGYPGESVQDYTTLAGYFVLFGGSLGLLIGLLRPLWFGIFLV